MPANANDVQVARGISATDYLGSRFASILVLLSCAFLYIGVSNSVIATNKYLLSKDRFPFPLHLVMMHVVFTFFGVSILYMMKPSLFSSITDPSRRVSFDRDLIVKALLPIGLFFAVELVFSNAALKHANISFLQMMKEGNLIIVYILAIIAALERFSIGKTGIVIFTAAATLMTVEGELAFSLTGLTMQSVSQLGACLKMTLQGLLLSGVRKLDVFTYILVVMPFCFAFLTSMWFVLPLLDPSGLGAAPKPADLVLWAGPLAASCTLAFGLNLAMALMIQVASAIGFLFVSIFKDAIMIILSVLFLKEVVSPIQRIGFLMQLVGVFSWSLIKTFPREFEEGFFKGLVVLAHTGGRGFPDALPIIGTSERKENALGLHAGYTACPLIKEK